MPTQIVTIDPATGQPVVEDPFTGSFFTTLAPQVTVARAPAAPTVVKAPTAPSTGPSLAVMRAPIMAALLKQASDVAMVRVAAPAGPATTSGAPSGTIPTSGKYQAGQQTGYIRTGTTATSVDKAVTVLQQALAGCKVTALKILSVDTVGVNLVVRWTYGTPAPRSGSLAVPLQSLTAGGIDTDAKLLTYLAQTICADPTQTSPAAAGAAAAGGISMSTLLPIAAIGLLLLLKR